MSFPETRPPLPKISQNLKKKFLEKFYENPEYLYLKDIMGNINEYKKRFNTLMESTMGDVKPLVSEQEQTTESPCNSAVKEIANKTGMKVHPQGHTAWIKKSDSDYEIVVACSIYGEEGKTIGFTIDTKELDPYPNDGKIENPLEIDILKTMGDVSFLGSSSTRHGSLTDWVSIPVTPENTNKIIELINNKVKPKLGM